MAIFDDIQKFNPRLQGYTKGFVPPVLDLNSLSDTMEASLETQKDELDMVNERVSKLSKIEDEITKIPVDNVLQKDLLDKAKRDVGIVGDNYFQPTQDDIRNPNYIRDRQRAYIALGNTPEMREILTEQLIASNYEKEIPKVEDRRLRAMAMKDLEKYRNGELSAKELNTDSYQSLDYMDYITKAIGTIDGDLELQRREDLDSVGTNVYQETRTRDKSLVDASLEPLINNERVLNNIMVDRGFQTKEEATQFILGMGDRYLREVEEFTFRTVPSSVYNKQKSGSSEVLNREVVLKKLKSQGYRMKEGSILPVEFSKGKGVFYDLEEGKLQLGDMIYEVEPIPGFNPASPTTSTQRLPKSEGEYIRNYEQVKPIGEFSSRENENGIYSVGDGGNSYGSYQMHKGLFKEFAQFVNSQLEDKLNITLVTGMSQDKQENLDFIEATVNRIGEDAYLQLEEQFLNQRRWEPAKQYAEEVFGVPLSEPVKVFVSDSANQHGRVNSGVIDRAKQIIDNNPQMDSTNQKDILLSLEQARIDYLNSLEDVSNKDSIISNRFNDLTEQLLQEIDGQQSQLQSPQPTNTSQPTNTNSGGGNYDSLFE